MLGGNKLVKFFLFFNNLLKANKLKIYAPKVNIIFGTCM